MNPTPPKVTVVKKKAKFTTVEDMVRLQLVLYAFTHHLSFSPGELSLLTHMAIHGYDVSRTPWKLVEEKKFLHPQSVRNARGKLLAMGVIQEPRKNHYQLNPELSIESHGVILVDFKAINA
jgi:hypothetical protein